MKVTFTMSAKSEDGTIVSQNIAGAIPHKTTKQVEFDLTGETEGEIVSKAIRNVLAVLAVIGTKNDAELKKSLCEYVRQQDEFVRNLKH